MSLKGDKYENAEEVKFRLEGSVVAYDGDPVYITRVSMPDMEDKGEIARVFFRPLPFGGDAGGKETRKFLSSRKFDLAPFKMGYLNTGKQAVFVSRSPVRQNRQGLCPANMSIADVKGKKVAGIGFANIIANKGFIDMVKGVYPSFKEVGDMLNQPDITSAAVSRSFALVIDHDLEALLLMHRGIRCGLAMAGDKGIRLAPKFHFLRQELEECRIPLA